MLNNTQRQLLSAAVDYLFEAIVVLEPPALGLAALRAIKDEQQYEQIKSRLETSDMLEVVDTLRRIYQHPCPQNRTTGSPYLGQEPGMVVWRDSAGSVRKEPVGILSLTAQNDNTAEPVTRLDVIQHLDILIEHYTVILQQKQIQVLEKKNTELLAQQNQSQASLVEPTSSLNFFALSEEALLSKALEHVEKRQHFEALAYLNQLVARMPQHAEYHYLRGKSLIHLKRRDEALADFNLAIHYHPHHAQTWVERGYTREFLQDILGAIQDYTKALQLNPNQHFALCQRGALRMQIGQVAAGESDFLASLQLKDTDPNTYVRRGEQYLYLRRYPQAIADFNEALRLKPNWQDVQAMKAEAERLQAHPELAQATLSMQETQSEAYCAMM